MLRTRRLLEATYIYCKEESKWIKIDDNIKIRYFKPYKENYFSIHVYIQNIEVLFASNRGPFGPMVYKIYKIPREAQRELNMWANDILSANTRMRNSLKKRARESRKIDREKIINVYKRK